MTQSNDKRKSEMKNDKKNCNPSPKLRERCAVAIRGAREAQAQRHPQPPFCLTPNQITDHSRNKTTRKEQPNPKEIMKNDE